jgi:hypothetical protein
MVRLNRFKSDIGVKAVQSEEWGGIGGFGRNSVFSKLGYGEPLYLVIL